MGFVLVSLGFVAEEVGDEMLSVLDHSTEIAGKCAEYIEKIIVADRRERSDSSKSDI